MKTDSRREIAVDSFQLDLYLKSICEWGIVRFF